jgi:hypothetical protein
MTTAKTSPVSLYAELPEELHEALLVYLEGHPKWTQNRVFCASLSLFLMQNSQCDRSISRIYLDSVFDFAA